TTDYSYDLNNRLTSAGATTYAYDNNGNLVRETGASGVTNYSYDGLDRLVSAAAPSGTTQLAYDAVGNRVRKTDGSGTINYLVDGSGFGDRLARVLRETDGSGAALADYTYGTGGALVSQQRGANVSFHLADGNGSTRLLTNLAGAVTDTYD